jgi:hypothetical protein
VQVDAELRSWWRDANSTHSPVLLAWSAVLCLMGKGGVAGGRRGAGAPRLRLPITAPAGAT